MGFCGFKCGWFSGPILQWVSTCLVVGRGSDTRVLCLNSVWSLHCDSSTRVLHLTSSPVICFGSFLFYIFPFLVIWKEIHYFLTISHDLVPTLLVLLGLGFNGELGFLFWLAISSWGHEGGHRGFSTRRISLTTVTGTETGQSISFFASSIWFVQWGGSRSNPQRLKWRRKRVTTSWRRN